MGDSNPPTFALVRAKGCAGQACDRRWWERDCAIPWASSATGSWCMAPRRRVDDADAPEGWILADRAGNKVCIATWPDGAMRPDP